jgi:hypothetical protein
MPFKVPSGKRRFIFNLVREGKDPVKLWEDNGDEETDANIVMIGDALQKAYNNGFADGRQRKE